MFTIFVLRKEVKFKMYILGLGGSGHDFSACISNENGVIGYIEDERITRIKHSFFWGNEEKIQEMNSVWYLFEKLGIEMQDIYKVYANNLLLNIFYKNFIDENNIVKIGHHKAHAASAYFPSEFEEAAILVIDGAGEEYSKGLHETTSYWFGRGNKIENIQTFGGAVVSCDTYIDYSMPFLNSIGGFYRVVTNLLGFGLFDEGKTMGLASYGTERYWSFFKNTFDISSDGFFLFDEESYRKIILLGNTLLTFEEKADFAYSAQKVTNIAVVEAARALYKKTKCRNLCIAGGVALNSVANYMIYKNKIFNDFFIQPSAGDAGTSIGAALYGYNQLV